MRTLVWLCAVMLLTTTLQAAIRHSNKGAAEVQNDKSITVAIIDTGVDIKHRDLRDVIWHNPGELGLDPQGRDKSKNGFDDDGNGYIDDVHGWNFAGQNNIVMDSYGHGTHVAGIVKHEFQRLFYKKERGAARTLKLMVLNYYNSDASDKVNLNNTARAIEYATAMGADIINYSGGGSQPNRLEHQAIEKAAQKGVLFIAAAGNNKSNTDRHRFYPAGYELNNIISVAATDRDGLLQDFSNYGAQSTDLAAPGAEINSTLPNNKYGLMSGTSQATAHITGVAAALLAEKPMASAAQMLARLIDISDYSSSLEGKTRFPLALLK
jgi:subtilisin family serine protease